jgi:hypothetical protein
VRKIRRRGASTSATAFLDCPGATASIAIPQPLAASVLWQIAVVGSVIPTGRLIAPVEFPVLLEKFGCPTIRSATVCPPMMFVRVRKTGTALAVREHALLLLMADTSALIVRPDSLVAIASIATLLWHVNKGLLLIAVRVVLVITPPISVARLGHAPSACLARYWYPIIQSELVRLPPTHAAPFLQTHTTILARASAVVPLSARMCLRLRWVSSAAIEPLASHHDSIKQQ